jgi:hypothetical protein
MKRPLPDRNAEAHQRLLDIAARADANEGIRQGLDDVANGRTRPAREFFDEFRRKHTRIEMKKGRGTLHLLTITPYLARPRIA